MSRTFDYKLPSGNEVTFREPFTRDRQKVINLLKPEDRYSVDELLSAYCLVAINGTAIRDPDPRHRMTNWQLKDQQAYTRLFLEMFTIGDEDMPEIREVAKKLLSGESDSSASNSASIEEPS